MKTQKSKLKILEITAFSAGICGVWTRVLAEASLLAEKGHKVHVFSSNIARGGDKIEIAEEHEEINNIKITRFPAKFSFGQNTFFWNYTREALNFKPDIIITHAYRQYYSTLALKIAKKLKIPCFLVTHAPFLDKKLRNWKLNFAVFIYDNFIGKRIINNYAKVLAITKWEIPHLLSLGCKKEKIIYSPNGIPEDFFILKSKTRHQKTRLLFLGRVAPIKDLKTLIKAIFLLGNKTITLDIVGPEESEYKNELSILIKKFRLEKQVNFMPAVYDTKEKIRIIDKHDIFILPSKREGMPQVLLEAIARKKIAISSNTDGGKEIIQDRKNGFLFEIGKEKQLADIISNIQNLSIKEKHLIENKAFDTAKKFKWKELIKKTENLLVN